MHYLVIYLALSLQVTARLVHRSLIPEDPHAFPKYHVSFLNSLPLLNDTAHHWLREGLHGGEPEFLDEPWQSDHVAPASVKRIDGTVKPHDNQPTYRLEQMKMGPDHSYLCLIPPEPQSHDTSFLSEETPPEVNLLHSWSLLQPLSGKCLYLRQGWFTYSYCHDSHVRQFREQAHTHPHPAGYRPEEDPESEAYTLGRAPRGSDQNAGADLTIAEQNVLAVNLELARGAGTRYLVQRWGGGTVCDKTGRQRETEIQFHCSMTMTDTILLIKETTTCHYVLVIQTPRLCGEPVFRSRLEAREESMIKCREIVKGFEQLGPTDEQHTLVEGSIPLHVRWATEAPTVSATQDPAPSIVERKRISAILNQLREDGLGNMLSFIDGELLMEDAGEDGAVLVTYEVDLDVAEESLTKGKQNRLIEDLWNALFGGESPVEDEDKDGGNSDDTEGDENLGHPIDEL